MSVVVTRMQDLASEFSIIFRDSYPGLTQREGATPSCSHPQLGLWPGAGRKRPGVGTQTFVPLTFQPWLRLSRSVEIDRTVEMREHGRGLDGRTVARGRHKRRAAARAAAEAWLTRRAGTSKAGQTEGLGIWASRRPKTLYFGS